MRASEGVDVTKRGLSLSATWECCCGGIGSPTARRPPEALVFERAHHRRLASSRQVGFPPASLGSPDFSKKDPPPRRLRGCHLQRRSFLHRNIRKRRHSGDHGRSCTSGDAGRASNAGAVRMLTVWPSLASGLSGVVSAVALLLALGVDVQASERLRLHGGPNTKGVAVMLQKKHPQMHAAYLDSGFDVRFAIASCKFFSWRLPHAGPDALARANLSPSSRKRGCQAPARDHLKVLAVSRWWLRRSCRHRQLSAPPLIARQGRTGHSNITGSNTPWRALVDFLPLACAGIPRAKILHAKLGQTERNIAH